MRFTTAGEVSVRREAARSAHVRCDRPHVDPADEDDVFIGKDQERPFEIPGDRLILRPKWTVDGKQWTGLRVFERVK